MAPTIDTRWPLLEHSDGFALPPWTRAEDTNNEDYVSTLRKLRFRHKRQDRAAGGPAGPNAGNANPSIPSTSTTTAGDESDSDSDGIDSDSDGDSGDEDEEEEEKDEKEEGEQKNEDFKKVPDEQTTTTVLTFPSETALAESNESATISHPGGIHSDVHKALIAVGSVVGLLLLAGVCFIGWRLRKRSRNREEPPRDDFIFDKPSRVAGILARVPILKKRFGTNNWYHIEEPSQTFYEKKQPPASPAFISRRLDSQFFAPDKPMGIADLSPIDTSRQEVEPFEVSPTSTMFGGDTAVNSPQEVSRNNTAETRHMPNQSISSLQVQYTLTTLPPPYNYHNPRQTAFSEMSSLSSGFGDGDIIMPPPRVPVAPHFRARSDAGSEGSERRDTVYTQGSEDSNPRFRTVNSWVRQQSKRVKRQRENETPPVPTLPLEQEFRLMMPDGEVPRRVIV